jgi:hypothetical protein
VLWLSELLHLPDKPAGVGEKLGRAFLATELFHLPDEPAGVAAKPASGRTLLLSEAITATR